MQLLSKDFTHFIKTMHNLAYMAVKKGIHKLQFTLFDNLRIQDTGEMVNWKRALIVHRPGENNHIKLQLSDNIVKTFT